MCVACGSVGAGVKRARIVIVGAVFATALLSSISRSAHAFDVEHSEARYVDKHFQYELVVTLNAPMERVTAVLRDFARYPSLNERILSATVLDQPEPEVTILKTTVKICFALFCRDVTRVERVEVLDHVLHAVADPARSDVIFNDTRSELSAAGHGTTRVKYITDVVPKFWVPAFGGRRWMLRMLANESSDLFRNVERRAAQPAPPP